MKMRFGRTCLTAKRILLWMMMAVMTFSFSFVAFEEAYAAGTNPTQAESLTYGKDAFGTITASKWGASDSHYYKFKTSSVKGINYTIRATCTKIVQPNGGGTQVRVYLLDDDYVAIKNDGTKVNTAISNEFGRVHQVGDVTSETFRNLKPNATYYVRIENYVAANKGDKVSYAVCVKNTVVRPGAPAITSLKAGKKGSRAFTVKYKKKSYANRYQIQVKKAGGSWRTFNNGTKLSRTFRKAHKGKYYYVRVRAQRKVSGKWYTGKWSTAKKVKAR